MYETLLKWGIKTLTQAGLEKGKHDYSVVIEAIKTKNALVLERFKIAEQATNDLMNLTIRIEADLKKFREKHSKGDNKTNFLNTLRDEFHPIYYNEYRKIRPQFDITNDLLSGYTIGLSNWVRFENISSLCKECDFKSQNDISRLYRMVWIFLLSTITWHLRLSSNDLRFWLTDKPYSKIALKWMQEHEFPALTNFLIRGLFETKLTHFPILESKLVLEEFWNEVVR